MSLGQLDKKDEACATFRELDRAIPDAPERVKEKSRQERNRLGCR
jgi:TolA-binding protein